MSKVEYEYCVCPIEHWQDVPDKHCLVCGRPPYSEWLERKRDQYSMVGRPLRD